MGDARNISRQTFKNTLNKFEEKHSSSIVIINDMISSAVKELKFKVCITKDVIPNIKNIAEAVEQYYRYRGYHVTYNEYNDGCVRIFWNIQNIAQPYNYEERK